MDVAPGEQAEVVEQEISPTEAVDDNEVSSTASDTDLQMDTVSDIFSHMLVSSSKPSEQSASSGQCSNAETPVLISPLNTQSPTVSSPAAAPKVTESTADVAATSSAAPADAGRASSHNTREAQAEDADCRLGGETDAEGEQHQLQQAIADGGGGQEEVAGAVVASAGGNNQHEEQMEQGDEGKSDDDEPVPLAAPCGESSDAVEPLSNDELEGFNHDLDLADATRISLILRLKKMQQKQTVQFGCTPKLRSGKYDGFLYAYLDMDATVKLGKFRMQAKQKNRKQTMTRSMTARFNLYSTHNSSTTHSYVLLLAGIFQHTNDVDTSVLNSLSNQLVLGTTEHFTGGDGRTPFENVLQAVQEVTEEVYTMCLPMREMKSAPVCRQILNDYFGYDE